MTYRFSICFVNSAPVAVCGPDFRIICVDCDPDAIRRRAADPCDCFCNRHSAFLRCGKRHRIVAAPSRINVVVQRICSVTPVLTAGGLRCHPPLSVGIKLVIEQLIALGLAVIAEGPDVACLVDGNDFPLFRIRRRRIAVRDLIRRQRLVRTRGILAEIVGADISDRRIPAGHIPRRRSIAVDTEMQLLTGAQRDLDLRNHYGSVILLSSRVGPFGICGPKPRFACVYCKADTVSRAAASPRRCAFNLYSTAHGCIERNGTVIAGCRVNISSRQRIVTVIPVCSTAGRRILRHLPAVFIIKHGVECPISNLAVIISKLPKPAGLVKCNDRAPFALIRSLALIVRLHIIAWKFSRLRSSQRRGSAEACQRQQQRKAHGNHSFWCRFHLFSSFLRKTSAAFCAGFSSVVFFRCVFAG